MYREFITKNFFDFPCNIEFQFDIIVSNAGRYQMAQLSLSGYLTLVDDNHAVLFGDNKTSFDNLGSEYWKRGGCKYVNATKTECRIKFDSATQFEKSGTECKVYDLDGCYVNVTARIKKYTFFVTSSGQPVKIFGWQIIAKKIKRALPTI